MFKAIWPKVLALGMLATASLTGHATELEPRARPAIDGILDLFEQKSIVALADAHGLAQEGDFYSALVSDPRFAEQVGNVIVEFGGAAAQDIVDRYVAGEQVPFTELRHVWTDVVGWLPGPTSIMYVNFFVSVRAANMQLPAERRIKVWLGEPKIDWSKVKSFADLQPLLGQRDEHVFSIVNRQILNEQKKALLIIGGGHLFGRGKLGPMIRQASPQGLAVVAPFRGYVEAECNARFVEQAKGWPVPAVVQIAGTALKQRLQWTGCGYTSKEEMKRIEKMIASRPALAQGAGPGKRPSMEQMLADTADIVGGVSADALLYLGPPESLLRSPIEPSFYLDPDYFQEISRRRQCCMPKGRPLDWQQLVKRARAVPRRYE